LEIIITGTMKPTSRRCKLTTYEFVSPRLYYDGASQTLAASFGSSNVIVKVGHVLLSWLAMAQYWLFFVSGGADDNDPPNRNKKVVTRHITPKSLERKSWTCRGNDEDDSDS
jgi:hypothetical protein